MPYSPARSRPRPLLILPLAALVVVLSAGTGSAPPAALPHKRLVGGPAASPAFSPDSSPDLSRELPPASSKAPLRVMTYNIRYASEVEPHPWSERRPLLLARLGEHQPDLLGVQEALWQQVRDLAGALPGYGWAGEGRQGGNRDEFGAVFYRRDRFRLLASQNFWLSDTPSVAGSVTWGNAYIRMATWVKLRDLRTGHSLYLLNTHLDNRSEYSRVRSAQLILQRVRGFSPGVPVLITGDFNTPAGDSESYRILTGPDALTDTWTAAARRGRVYSTHTEWRPATPGGGRIDWILSRGAVRTLATRIDIWHDGDRYPSDHFPVIADLVVQASADSG